jgi:hypothetical protein
VSPAAAPATSARAPAAALAPRPRHDGLGERLLACRRRRVVAEPLVQRAVRIDDGTRKVGERKYQPGGLSAQVGSRYSVAALIADAVPRVFEDEAELKSYANGQTDHIGDVVTARAGTFWYRLPRDDLTVLGEEHSNPDGTVQDVLRAFRTARFMYEPFNAVTNVAALNVDHSKTTARLGVIDQGLSAGLVRDPAFEPALENAVLKALAGTTLLGQFSGGDPAAMGPHEQAMWSGRANAGAWSQGERCALYLALAVQLAEDIAEHDFPRAKSSEPPLTTRGRELKAMYKKHKSVLRGFMRAKEADDLVGVYELTAPKGFRSLPKLDDFASAFHAYAAEYIAALGAEKGNAELTRQGRLLENNRDPTIRELGAAREEIMWERIAEADVGGYLLVGIGDNHRVALARRLRTAGIAHAKVDEDLVAQRAANQRQWLP